MKKVKTIVVIDDDIALGLLMKHILGAHFEVKIFDSGIEGLSWLSEGNETDLIVTDIVMSDFNGFDLLTNLKSSGLFREIPVIVVSSFFEPEKKDEALALGAAHYLSKPFNPETLKNVVFNLLNDEIIANQNSESYA